MPSKLDVFKARTQTDDYTLLNLARELYMDKLRLEFKNQFGEMPVKEMEGVYNELIGRTNASQFFGDDPKIIVPPKKKVTKKKTKKKTRRKQ